MAPASPPRSVVHVVGGGGWYGGGGGGGESGSGDGEGGGHWWRSRGWIYQLADNDIVKMSSCGTKQQSLTRRTRN